MIMALIRLHANIHTLEGLQGYRQSKIHIEPAAVHYWWALRTPIPSCPKLQPQAVTIPLDTWRGLFWYTHGSGSFAFVLIVLPPFSLHCVLRTIGKHHHSLETCSPSPSASFRSLVRGDMCACRAWRSTSLCYIYKLFPTNPLTCYFLHTWLLEVTLLFPALVS